ncbi:MAG: ribonuclease E/G, partial [Clostridia bacterium]|nr:ribonuclease E/G [Clostridia bacterium]
GGDPRLLLGRPSALERFLRDTKGGVDQILSDAPVEAVVSVPVEVREHPMALYNVTAQWEKAGRRLHHLPGGGNIVIDPCEAMTVIDVNTAMDTGSRRGAEDARTRVNLEAAAEIARLLQLRAVGGIILIDFIDMDDENNRAAVMNALQKALETDPCKTVLHGFTSLGLMEMTRKKS